MSGDEIIQYSSWRLTGGGAVTVSELQIFVYK